MSNDWINEGWDDDFDLGIEIVTIAYATAEPYSKPNDPVVTRIRETVRNRIEALEGVWLHFDTVRGDLDVPVQRALEGDALSGLAEQMDQSYLQLSLFADHSELTLSAVCDEITASVRDLVGAIVIEQSDERENTLVADLIGLLRRDGSPVEEISEIALSVFEAILSIATSRSLFLWDAHEMYLRSLPSR